MRVLSAVKSFRVSCVRHIGIIFIFRKPFQYGYGTFRCFSREATHTHNQGFIPVRICRERSLCLCWAIIFHDVCRPNKLYIDQMSWLNPNRTIPKQTELNSTQPPTGHSNQIANQPFRCRNLRYAHPIKSIKTTKTISKSFCFHGTHWGIYYWMLCVCVCVCMQNMYADIYIYK